MTICEREIIYNSKAPDIDEEETKKKTCARAQMGPQAHKYTKQKRKPSLTIILHA